MDALPDTACVASDSDSDDSASANVMLDYDSASDELPSLVDSDSADDEPPLPPRQRVTIALESSSKDEDACDLPPLTFSQWHAIHDQDNFKELAALAEKRC